MVTLKKIYQFDWNILKDRYTEINTVKSIQNQSFSKNRYHHNDLRSLYLIRCMIYDGQSGSNYWRRLRTLTVRVVRDGCRVDRFWWNCGQFDDKHFLKWNFFMCMQCRSFTSDMCKYFVFVYRFLTNNFNSF